MSAVRASQASVPMAHGLDNSIKTENGQYQIQWVISDFAQRKDEFHSPVFTQTSVKIVLQLKFVNDKGVLIIKFLEFPGFKVNYEVELCNSKVETKKGERTFLFEEGKREDTWALGIARNDLTEEEGWLLHGALVVRVMVHQPPSQKNLLNLNSLKCRAAPVSYVNGVYTFQWRFEESEIGDGELASREFRCGEIRVCASILGSALTLRFEVKRDVQVAVKMTVVNAVNELSKCVEVSGVVTPKEPKLDVWMPCGVRKLVAQGGFAVDGVVTIEFQMTCKFLVEAVGQTSNRISMMLPVAALELPQANFLHVPLPSPIREDVGLVGLSNLGSTCYMSSLLQVLFHIPAVRKFVYSLPTDGLADQVPCELQKLFALMQFRSKTCSTLAFASSFGWSESEVVAQRDIEKFAMELFCRLKAVDSGIDDLFAGKQINHWKFIGSGEEKTEEETVHKFTIEVAERQTLEHGLQQYVAEERLIEEFTGFPFSSYWADDEPMAARDATPGIKPRIEAALLTPPKKGDETYKNNDYATPGESEAVYIADMIEKMMSGDDYLVPDKDGKTPRRPSFGDIAVLLQTTAGQRDFEKVFRMRNIPYVVPESSSITTEAIASDIYSFLQCLIYPDDKTAYMALLRSPFARISDKGLLLFADDESFEGAFSSVPDFQDAGDIQAFSSLSALYRKVSAMVGREPVSHILDVIYYESGYHTYLASRADLAVYEDHFSYLWEAAAAFDKKGKPLVLFLDHLRPLLGSSSKLENAAIQHFGSDAVSIMTIHKSKGLQFPVVFLADSARGPSNQSAKNKLAFAEGKNPLLMLDPDDAGAHPFSKLFNDARIRREEAERDRLLYVALTRASVHIIITGVKKQNSAKSQSSERWHTLQHSRLPLPSFLPAKPYTHSSGLSSPSTHSCPYTE